MGCCIFCSSDSIHPSSSPRPSTLFSLLPLSRTEEAKEEKEGKVKKERRKRGWWVGGWRRLKTLDKRWPPSCCRSDTHSWNTPATSPRKTKTKLQFVSPPTVNTAMEQQLASSPLLFQPPSSDFFWFQRPNLSAHSTDAADFSPRLLTGSN